MHIDMKTIGEINKNSDNHELCMEQAPSQAISNHMVQDLRAHFILYVIAIKRMMYAQEKIELSSVSQRSWLSLTENLRDLSLDTKI